MLYQLKEINEEQYFVIVVFVLSVVSSFLLGYVLFRYVQIDLCKSDMEVLTTQGISGNLH